MELTKTNNSRVMDINKKVIGIYGRAGIGKSTIASMFDGVYFAATEAGLRHLDVRKTDIHTWEEFLEFLGLIAKNQDPTIKCVCIDTVTNLVPLVHDYICRLKGIEEIGDYKKFGAWHLATAELQRVLNKLSLLPVGLILICHSTREELETRTMKVEKATLDIGGKNKNVVLNMLQTLLYIETTIKDKTEIGVIRTKPSLYWEAKDKDKFFPDTIEFPLDKPEIAFKKMMDCINKKEGGS